MSSVNKPSSETSDKNCYLHISDYNKLKTKYDNKIKENKKLKECIDNLMQSYDSMKEQKNSMEEMLNFIKDLLKNKKSLSKPKEEFSTTSSSYSFLVSDNLNNTQNIAYLKTSSKSINSNFNVLNSNKILHKDSLLTKKIEDLENLYNDLSKDFNNLILKYKCAKEEKNKVDEYNILLLEQIGTVNNEYNNIVGELNDCHITIERFKEIDKCILDTAINSLFLNTNEKKINKKEDNNNYKIINNPYVLCEPVPTFVKFINKFTK